MTTADLLLQMHDVRKSFAGTPALVDGDLEVRRGEIHALMGQNGAGKSTLLKILTGVYAKDAGEIRFEGKHVEFASPHEAQDAGISAIYQEINLVHQRTVAENMFLGREPRRWGLIDRRRMTRESEELLGRVGVSVDPTRPLGDLNTATQQMVAIARALSFEANLLIMDEPTSSLHDREVATLFEVLRNLRDSGVSIIFVSHKLDELYEICDTITILRDGETVASGAMDSFSKVELIATLLGKNVEDVARQGQTAFDQVDVQTGEPVLQTQNLASWPALRDASMTVRTGEIVGLAGLLGSGRSEFAHAVAGSAPVDGGTATVMGGQEAPTSPAQAAASGVALTPEDRKVEGLVAAMSVRENLTLPLISRLSRFGVINRRRETDLVQRYVERLHIKSSGLDQYVSELSGGNQQKVLLARSLALEPKLLILDEPTRGVDVGAKGEIQSLISESVDEGRGVLLISSEMEEIVEGSDRVYVLRDGEIVAELNRAQASAESIMAAMASDDSLSTEGGGEAAR